MPLVERVVRYRFDGREFDDLGAVAKYVENEIGKIIDTTANRVSSRERVAVFDALIAHRRRLCQLLAVEYDPDPDGGDESPQSIFELGVKPRSRP